MSERFWLKREAGLPMERPSGEGFYSPEVDRQAKAAEDFACERLGGQILEPDTYATHGDKGADILVNGMRVDVVWLGFGEPYRSQRPRLSGHLIVGPKKEKNLADVYVLVIGTIEAGFTLAGYIGRDRLLTYSKRMFWNTLKLAVPIGELDWFE